MSAGGSYLENGSRKQVHRSFLSVPVSLVCKVVECKIGSFFENTVLKSGAPSRSWRDSMICTIR